MDYKEILLSLDGPISSITLNNPAKINALSKTMIAELIDALSRVSGDDRVKVVIVKSAGKHFSAGHHLAEMVDLGVKETRFIFEQCARMMQLIHDIQQPVIAQVQGIATAAGCQLVAWCDLAVAGEGARFSTPGVKIGLFCTTPMVALSRAVGRKAALEMLLTGREVPAREAKQLGLVNQVVPLAELDQATLRLARQIADASAFTVGIGKHAFYAQIDQSDEAAMDLATRTMVMNTMADDAQAGMKAFLNKESPVWKNR